MSVSKVGGTEPVRPLGTGKHASEALGEGGAPQRADAASKARGDKVALSAEGMALASRLSEIQGRMAEGFYDNPEVAQAVADRLLFSGDLGL